MKRSHPARQKHSLNTNTQSTTHTHTKGYTFAILTFFTLFILLILVGLVFMIQSAFHDPYQAVQLGSLEKSKQSAFVFPTQNDSLVKGKAYTLMWHGGPPTIESMHLSQKGLSDQAVSIPIAENAYSLENMGSYEFTVPETIPNGLYRIEAGPLMSDYFEITSE